MVVTVTPQFGGKVWGMRDKVAGREFFFRNDAHQPANIGARGAWVSKSFFDEPGTREGQNPPLVLPSTNRVSDSF